MDELTFGLGLHRASDDAPPLDPGAFSRQFTLFCQARNSWPDERELAVAGDAREVDLYQLHAAVRNQGGMEAVTRKALWAVISAQLGFADYPATAVGPAKSGPGTADAVKAVFADHLDAFDQLCVEEWRRSRSGRTRSHRPPNNGRSYEGAPASRSTPEPSLPSLDDTLTTTLSGLSSRSTAGNFSSEGHYPAATESEIGGPEDSLGNTGSWVPQLASSTNHEDLTPPHASFGPLLHQPRWNSYAALQIALSGWRPSLWPPYTSKDIPIAESEDQVYATALQFLNRSDCAAGNVSVVMDKLFRSVTPERYAEAQTYVAFFKQYRLTAIRENALAPVTIPPAEHERYYTMFNHMWTIIQCLDAQLALHALWFVPENDLQRSVDMLILVQEQFSLMDSSEPRYVLDFQMLVYCAAILESHFVGIENMLNAVFTPRSGSLHLGDLMPSSPHAVTSSHNSPATSSPSPPRDLSQNEALIARVAQARRIIEGYKTRWLQSFDAQGRRIVPNIPADQAAIYSTAWQELLAQAMQMDKRLPALFAFNRDCHASAEKIAYIIAAVFEQQRVSQVDPPEYILSLELILRFTHALQVFAQEAISGRAGRGHGDAAPFSGPAAAAFVGAPGGSSPTPMAQNSISPANAGLQSLLGSRPHLNASTSSVTSERLNHAETQVALLRQSLTRRIQVLLQVPLLVGPEDAVHEWEALWVTVLAARDALVPLVAPYLACTGDPEGARDMVQNLVNVDEQEQLLHASEEPRRVVCRAQLREWLQGCETSAAMAQAGIASRGPMLGLDWQ